MNDKLNEVLHNCIYIRATDILCSIKTRKFMEIPLDIGDHQIESEELKELKCLVEIEKIHFDLDSIQQRVEGAGISLENVDEEETEDDDDVDDETSSLIIGRLN